MKASEQLEDAGLRVPGGDRRPRRTRRSRARRPGPGSRGSNASCGRRDDVQSVSSYYTTRSTDFVSNDRRSTYLSVALKPTDDKEWQESGADDRRTARGPARGHRRRRRRRPGAGQQAGREGPADGPRCSPSRCCSCSRSLFFRSLVAALLPVMIGALAIVGTFLVLRIASEFGSISIFALNLTTGLGLGLAIDYSLFIVSRYREEIAKDGPGLAAMRRVMATAGPDRLLLLADRRGGARLAARLPAALPLLDGPRRVAGGAARGADLADRAAGGADPARDPGQLARRPRFLQRRAEADARPDEHGFWYRLSRLVMRRPIPIATLSAAFLIVLGLPFFGDQVQHRRPDRAAEGRQRPPGLRHGQRGVPALPRDADLGLGRRRRPGEGDRRSRRGSAAPRASPRSTRRSRCTAA